MATSGRSEGMRRAASFADAGLADDLDVVGRLEQLPQAAADDLVVVQEEHADGHSWSTPVPLEGGLTQVSAVHPGGRGPCRPVR